MEIVFAGGGAAAARRARRAGDRCTLRPRGPGSANRARGARRSGRALRPGGPGRARGAHGSGAPRRSGRALRAGRPGHGARGALGASRPRGASRASAPGSARLPLCSGRPRASDARWPRRTRDGRRWPSWPRRSSRPCRAGEARGQVHRRAPRPVRLRPVDALVRQVDPQVAARAERVERRPRAVVDLRSVSARRPRRSRDAVCRHPCSAVPDERVSDRRRSLRHRPRLDRDCVAGRGRRD